jgi:ribosomal protein S6
MMEQKSLYETVFVVNSALGEEAVQAICDKFTSLIEANAEVESVNVWGNRKFATPSRILPKVIMFSSSSNRRMTSRPSSTGFIT